MKNPKRLLHLATLATAAVLLGCEAPRVEIDFGSAPATSASAKVTIVEFGDFECPYCRAFSDTARLAIQEYGKDQVRLVWKDFPLFEIHNGSLRAAEAARAAGSQGYFWDMHDQLFQNQSYLDTADLEFYANRLGLQMEPFKNALLSHEHLAGIRADYRQGWSLGVRSTPTIFINGVMVEGAIGFRELSALIERELAR